MGSRARLSAKAGIAQAFWTLYRPTYWFDRKRYVFIGPQPRTAPRLENEGRHFHFDSFHAALVKERTAVHVNCQPERPSSPPLPPRRPSWRRGDAPSHSHQFSWKGWQTSIFLFSTATV